jgi:rod shape-determining protein MreD
MFKKILFIISIALLFKMVFLYFGMKKFIPNFLFIVVIYAALYEKILWAEFLGFLLGIFEDLFTLHMFGTSALLFPLLAFVVGYLSLDLDKEKIFLQGFILFCGSWLYLFGFYWIHVLFGYSLNIQYSNWIFTRPFLNVFIGLLMFSVLKKTTARFQRD